MKRICILLGLLCLTSAGAVGTLASEVLTLQDSIEIALARSLTVYSAEEELKTKKFEQRAVQADFYPKFATGFTYTRLDNDTVNDGKSTTWPYNPSTASHEMMETSLLNTNTYELDITVTQPVFTGWRLSTQRDLASLGVNIAGIQKETIVQNLVLNIKEAYFGILKTEKLQDVASLAVEQLNAHLKVSQAFYDEGIIPKNDLLETEVQLAQARQDLIRAANRLEIAKSLFNKLLRRGLDSEVRIEDILEYHPTTLTLNQCTERAQNNRTEIKEVSLNIRSAQKTVDLNKSTFYPNVNLVGKYERETGDFLLETTAGEDPDIWSLTLRGEWSIWEWGKRYYQVGAARAQLMKAQYVLDELIDTIQLQVKDSYLVLREAEKNIHVAKKAVVQAEENFRMNEERYKQQVATSTDVLDAQTLLTQARANYFNALSEHNIAWARLERAMGVTYESVGRQED